MADHPIADSATATAGDSDSPRVEHRYHAYTGNDIPWYVRAIWIGFWIFAVTYTIRFLLPAMQVELIGPK